MALKSFKKNALMNIVKTISAMIFPLITFPYVSRILGPEGVGKINFATSFVSYFTLLASLGIPLYGIREVARNRDNKEKLPAIVQELLVMHIYASVIVFCLFLIVVYVTNQLNDEKTLFFIVSFSILLTTIGMEWLYQGLEEYTYITIRSLIFSTISVISIFFLIHNKNDYLISAAITVFSSMGSMVLNFYNARKIVFAKRKMPWNFKRHIKPLALVYAMNFIISIYVQLDTVFLGFLSTTKNVGYYTSALKLTKMLLMVVTSFGAVLLPRLSYLISNKQMDDFNRMLKKSIAFVFMLCLPIVVSLMLLSKEIILVFAGEQYTPAAGCMIITAPLILFIGLTNIFGIQILYPLGKDKKVLFSVAAGSISSVVLNIILIPQMAHYGAAVTTLISELVVLIMQVIILMRIYPIKLPYNQIKKHALGTAVIILIIIIVKQQFDLLWIRLLVAAPAGIVLYFITLAFMKEDLTIETLTKLKARLFHV